MMFNSRKSFNQWIFILGLFLAVGVPSFALDQTLSSLPVKCTETDIDAISANHARQPIEIDRYTSKADGTVIIQWSKGVKASSDVNSTNVLFMFVPDEGLVEYFTSKREFNNVGGIKFFHSDLTNPLLTTAPFKIDPSMHYHVYSGGFVCNPELESKKGLIKWMLYRNSDGRPKPITASSSDIKVDALDISELGGDATGKVLVSIRMPTVGGISNSQPLLISSGGSTLLSATPTQVITDFSTYRGKFSSGDVSSYLYSNANGYNWVGVLDKSKVVNDKLDVSIPEIVAGKTEISRDPQNWMVLKSHWSTSLVDNMTNAKGVNYTGSVIGLTSSILLEGIWIDRGSRFISNIESEPSKSALSLNRAVAVMLNSQSAPQSFGEYIEFPESFEQEAFVNGYSKIDFSFLADQSANCSSARNRYFLEWGKDISVWKYKNSKLMPLSGCDEKCEEVSVKNGWQSGNVSPVSCDDLKELGAQGVWVRYYSDQQWALDADNSTPIVSDFFKIKLHVVGVDKTSITTIPSGGYSDPRPIINTQVLGFKWNVDPSGRTAPPTKLPLGWSSAHELVIPIGNSIDLKFVSSGIFGIQSPTWVIGQSEPIISQISTTDGIGGVLSPMLTFDRKSGSEFSASISEADYGPSQFDDNTQYQAMFSLGYQVNNPRLLAPVNYYPNHSINFVLLAGDAGSISREQNRKIAQATAKYLLQKRHKYTEIVDFSNWNWGGVYFYKTGLNLHQRQELDIATIFNGIPKYLSSHDGLKSKALPYEFGLTLGGSISDHLSDAQQAEVTRRLGKPIESYDFSDVNIQREFGFTKIDPVLWDHARTNIGLTTPEMLCYTHVNSEGLSCFSPVWVNKTVQTADLLLFQALFPEIYAGYGVYEISEGHVASGILDIAPAGLKILGAAGTIGKGAIGTEDYIRASKSVTGEIASTIDDAAKTATSASGFAENEISLLVKDLKVQRESEVLATQGPDVGIGFVLESQGKYDPVTKKLSLTAAQEYDASARGAFSSIADKQKAVPYIRWKNPNPKGYNFKKFDGIESYDFETKSITFIDRKCYGCAGGETKLAPSTAKDTYDALMQNKIALKRDVKLVYEFADEATQIAAQKMIVKYNLSDLLSTRYVPR